MARSNKSVLLFNPWIYDFAAYDFWIKPLGLLYIGAILQKLDYEVHLIDCLDRFHPKMVDFFGGETWASKADLSGKFHREIIEKPSSLKHVPRRYARYGMPPDIVRDLLHSFPPPDVILVTSFMTYWYPAVRDAVDLLRTIFPHTKIILGGIYATLCPEHAKKNVKPDFLICGEGEVQAVRLVAELLDGPGANFCYANLDELPFPAFDLYPDLRFVNLLASRGCPNNCSFCASRTLTSGYRRRSDQNIVDEIRYWHSAYDVSHFAFYDDALLHQADRYLKPVLRRIGDEGWMLNFYTPNGLTPRYVDQEIADLFFKTNIRSIRLSFETSNAERQKSMSAKVTNAELETALIHLERAGYNRSDIGVYILFGLPDQSMEEARESVHYVHDLGARVTVASFSPIPGTREWDAAVLSGAWNPQADLLLTNTTVYPIWSTSYGFQACDEFMHWTRTMNKEL